MMKMMMRPQPSQFPPQRVGTSTRAYLWAGISATSDVTPFIMFGFTRFQIACIGGAGGRAGKYLVDMGSNPDLVYYPCGGGGGGISIYEGNLSELALRTSIVAGNQGTTGVDKTTSGSVNGHGSNGGNGVSSTYGPYKMAYPGSGAIAYDGSAFSPSYRGFPGQGGSGNTGSGGQGGYGDLNGTDPQDGAAGAVGTPYLTNGSAKFSGYGGNGGGANISSLFIGTVLEGDNGIYGSGRAVLNGKGAVFLKVW